MAENENTFLSANEIYEEVEGEAGKALTLEESQELNLVGIIKSRYALADTARDSDERRWLQAYENYRGLYSKGVKFRESEKSRVFVKITKTKTLAAYSQIVDVLFAGNKFPISIEPTELPEGVSENVHINIEPNPMEDQEKPPELPLEFKDGELPKGYRAGIQLGPLEQKLSPVSYTHLTLPTKA